MHMPGSSIRRSGTAMSRDGLAAMKRHESNQGIRVRNLLLFLLLLALCVAPIAAAAADFVATVVHVTDGDTILIELGNGKREFVRVAAIDAPEKRRKDRPGQPYAQRSREHLSGLVGNRQVRLVSKGRDDYERIVARVWLDDMEIGLAQVCAGFAWVFERFIAEFPPEDQRAYRDCQATARQQRRGLWRDAQPIAPWRWRHGKRSLEAQGEGREERAQ